jgi:alpha-L-fucosidase 2
MDVLVGKTGAKVVDDATGPVVSFRAAAGTSYLLERVGFPVSNQRFAPVGGTPAISAKKLGPVQLGLFRSVR